MKKVTAVLFYMLLVALPAYGWEALYTNYLNPSWSSDGKMLAYETVVTFTGGDGDWHDIVVKSLDKKKIINLTYDCANLSVSPDSDHVLINDSFIYDCVNPSGIDKYIDITIPERSDIRRTAWAPDSSKFAYVVFNYNDGSNYIAVYDLKRHTNRIIVKNQYKYDSDDYDMLAWEGSRIIYSAVPAVSKMDDGSTYICSVNEDGTGRAVIPRGYIKPRKYEKKKSAASKRGVYSLVKEGQMPEQYSLQLKDNSGAVSLAIPGNGSYPAWRPGSNSIAFVFTRNGKPDIWEADLDHGTYKQLTFEGGEKPVWSLDGKRLAFKRGKSMYIINNDGGNARKMKDDESDAFPAAVADKDGVLSPDGRMTAVIKEGTTKDYESYGWSELIVRKDNGEEIMLGAKETNF